jgi:LPPG:FO 2-phospho-L-lactate transferase
MSEQLVRTILLTDQGELAFQDYFVKQRAQPMVKEVRFVGADTALPSREVTNALRSADLIIFCPSNPLLSIDPILSMPSLRRIIAASRVPKVGVSPIVGGAALKGPAAKMMQELGLEVSPLGVARHLNDVLTALVIDQVDVGYQAAIEALGLKTLVAATVMANEAERVRLAQEVLAWAVST